MNGHRESFTQIYEEHSEAIYRHCFFRMHSAQRAEELVQDIFMKFWRYMEAGNDIKNVKGLLYRIADHTIIDEKRKHTTESLDNLMERDGFDIASPAHHEIETWALYKEALRELATLRDDEQQVFILRFVDDLNPKEIATIMGTTANTISVQLNRIIVKLKAKII
jgi:RNA polymerase sigma-70 factor (ECF subfamily)